MYKDIIKRTFIQILIYSIIFYLIPYVSINFLSETMRDTVNALFLVVFNLLIIIAVATFDSYKYKLNWFSWAIPGLLFIPATNLFFGNMDLLIYALLYSGSYGIGMLLGWSYRVYGYQLKPGYKKTHNEIKRKESQEKREEKAKIKEAKKSKKESTTKNTNTKNNKGTKTNNKNTKSKSKK